MSKLKITIEPKEEVKQGCKHEVGGVYKYGEDYYLLGMYGAVYYLINLVSNCITTRPYHSLEEIDLDRNYDIPVDAELIIREVK